MIKESPPAYADATVTLNSSQVGSKLYTHGVVTLPLYLLRLWRQLSSSPHEHCESLCATIDPLAVSNVYCTMDGPVHGVVCYYCYFSFKHFELDIVRSGSLHDGLQHSTILLF